MTNEYNGWIGLPNGVALAALFCWLVPHIFVEIAQYRVALIKSPSWEGDKGVQGLRAITFHSFLAIGFGLVIVSATAAVVALSTKEMDENMLLMMTGISILFSAVTLFLISVQIPTWLSLYHSEPKVVYAVDSLKSLRFNVAWSIWRYFFMIYFLLLPFFCSSIGPAEIPICIIFGIIGGFSLCLGVYYGRTNFKAQKRSIAVIMVLVLCIFASISFAEGCSYVKYVWSPREGQGKHPLWVFRLSAIVSWLAVVFIFHGLIWCWSAKKFRKEEKRRESGLPPIGLARFTTDVFHPIHLFGVTAFQSSKHDTTVEASDSESNESEEFEEWNFELRPNFDKNDKQMAEHVQPKTTDVDIECQKKEDVIEEDNSVRSLIKARCCYYPTREGMTQKMSKLEKTCTFLKWTVWFLASMCALFVTVVSIGAVKQAHIVKGNLHKVHDGFYANMNEGPVCAFLDTGIKSPHNTITFESAEAALLLNYTIAHCGACGACSTWNNLKLEWTTRTNLALKTAQCAKKGARSKSAELQCMDDTVGFDDMCTQCWIEDFACTRKHCAFIGLQQMIIKTLSNFTVDPKTITAATCEEAMCEMEFVPCSGANRRRMNIDSDIGRPVNQQCTRVDASQWLSFFGP